MLEGLTLTVIGMAVVFIFLTLLVILMSIISPIINRFFPEKEEAVVKTKKGKKEIEIVVAIAAAKAFSKK